MTDEILKLNTNNELVAEDPSTGNTRPIKVVDLSASGDVSAANVTADTQMNSSSTRPNIFANDVDANSITGVSTGADRQGCRVFLSSPQSISAGNIADINFDSVAFDSGNNFDTAASAWTCPKDGLYAAHLMIHFDGGGSGEQREAYIAGPGNPFQTAKGSRNTANSTATEERIHVSTINKYSSGDQISALARNNASADTVSSGNSTGSTHFEISFLGGL